MWNDSSRRKVTELRHHIVRDILGPPPPVDQLMRGVHEPDFAFLVREIAKIPGEISWPDMVSLVQPLPIVAVLPAWAYRPPYPTGAVFPRPKHAGGRGAEDGDLLFRFRHIRLLFLRSGFNGLLCSSRSGHAAFCNDLCHSGFAHHTEL